MMVSFILQSANNVNTKHVPQLFIYHSCSSFNADIIVSAQGNVSYSGTCYFARNSMTQGCWTENARNIFIPFCQKDDKGCGRLFVKDRASPCVQPLPHPHNSSPLCTVPPCYLTAQLDTSQWRLCLCSLPRIFQHQKFLSWILCPC